MSRARSRKCDRSPNSQPKVMRAAHGRGFVDSDASVSRNAMPMRSICTPVGHTLEHASHSRQLSRCSTASGVISRWPSTMARMMAMRPRGPSSSLWVTTYVGHDVRHAAQRMQRSMLSYSTASGSCIWFFASYGTAVSGLLDVDLGPHARANVQRAHIAVLSAGGEGEGVGA